MIVNWKGISERAQDELLQSIPTKWKIDRTQYAGLTNVSQVPVTCGLLSEKQIQITELTVTELAAQIRTRTLKATEVLEAFATRAVIAHQLVNCLADWFYEDGLEQAKQLDDLLEAGGSPKGPLHGIPVALKDTFDLQGRATTRGFVINKGKLSGHDSDIIQTLRSAGAVFFCRTTMPQTGFILETVSNLWGRTINPFNNKFGAGGSSGGDAVLVAMKGCPIAPSTDMGGSIRVPAAFNGLYAIRPTSQRIPKGGWGGSVTGQISVRDSAGPVCHSVDDLKLLTEVIGSHNSQHRYDTNSVPIPWRQISLPEGKLAVGIMKWDGVVMPHPPILRAIEETKQSLLRHGFEDGGADAALVAAATGEPLVPAFLDLLKVYSASARSAPEVLKLNIKMRAYKVAFAQAWDDTKHQLTTGRPMDALICPVSPSSGIPHDFNVWWGYTCMWNLLDYPSTVLPVPISKTTVEQDPPNISYTPLSTNPYDKANHEMYDPKLFENLRPCIQMVARPFDDEELLEMTAEVDKVLRGCPLP
ncbi:unnamed protein product [Clonostachys rhizophaga]|uniref:Amidase domain-containing protein n=1 Tax=Clonostachys rhizophaga TaxID=160324 RepID=A0A9N9VP92_9HYPO|nr:unnamed protein product [Clonostachys rhizophaga]